MEYEDYDNVVFGPGEIVIVPKGVVHRPLAETEAMVLLIEPEGEPNSGNSDRQASRKEKI